MSRKLLIDTNILLRLITKDNLELANRARNIVNSADQIIVADIVLMEVEYGLSKAYKMSRDLIVQTFRLLSTSKNVQVADYINEAINIFRTTNLDFVDCILIAKANEENLELATFDRAMLKHHNKHKSTK